MKNLKILLQKLIEDASKIQYVDVEADTLDVALNKGCEKLNCDISDIDYEIIESGDKGFFGFGKKKYKIRVYKGQSSLNIFERLSQEAGLSEVPIEEKIIDRDGEVFVRLFRGAAWLKISPPIGNGQSVTEDEVRIALESRNVQNYDMNKVKKIIKEEKNEYVRICDMPLNIVNDSTASVQISSDKMKAYVLITPPKTGGYDLEPEQIIQILKNNGVIVGIKEDVIQKLLDYPEYDKPILVAEGIKVKNGEDAYIKYNFNTSNKIDFSNNEGQIDFKSLNTIQNVMVGQVLAVKVPATNGEPGKTVDGELILPKPGKDIELVAGKNTQVSEDGLSIIALKNGQVSLVSGKVNVEEVYTVQGNVNLKTGNITFLGSVIVTGDVEDTFEIVAEGNIEIKGSVGKCKLQSEGDIIIGGGIAGKGEAYIRAGKSLYSKYIEQVKKIDAGIGVYVQDGIMHSNVDATKEICCTGKRATIVGGVLRASELIKTGTLGSSAGTETQVEVGVDPKRRQQLIELSQEQENAYKQLEQVEVNFNSLNNMKKQMKDRFPKEKEEVLKSLGDEVKRLKEIIQTTSKEIDEINQYLLMIKNQGKVIATKIVYPGVKIYIKTAMLPIKTEYKATEFVLENEEVNALPYKEEKVDDRRR